MTTSWPHHCAWSQTSKAHKQQPPQKNCYTRYIVCIKQLEQPWIPCSVQIQENTHLESKHLLLKSFSDRGNRCITFYFMELELIFSYSKYLAQEKCCNITESCYYSFQVVTTLMLFLSRKQWLLFNLNCVEAH